MKSMISTARRTLRCAACLPFLILNSSFLILLSSCDHKGFGEPAGAVRVRVVFDWADAPDAAPQGMCLWMYAAADDGAATPRRFDLPRDGGEIDLPAGAYSALCYNNDTEAAEARNTATLRGHTLATRDANPLEPVLGNAAQHAPRAAGAEEEPCVLPPDQLWGVAQTDIHVAATGETVITLRPHLLTCTYSCEIRHVKNLRHVAQLSATLSGLAPTLRPAQESLATLAEAMPDGPATLPFEAAKADTATIAGQFHTFGCPLSHAAPHRLLLYVWLDDGQKLVYGTEAARFEVSEQIHAAPDRHHVHIIIDGLDLPTPMDDGNGFDASADDWQTEHHDIEL